MAYNNSPLSKEEWEQARKKCLKDPVLEKVFKTFSDVYNGSEKRAIETYDKVIDFIDTAVDVITNLEDIGDDEEFGFNDGEASKRTLLSKLLKDKDDKTPERLNSLLDKYPKYIEEREKILNRLSPEDKDEATSGGHRLAKIALQQKNKNKADDNEL